MSGDEPRRSVRSTKGVNNKHAEPSPAPTPKPAKSKSKPARKTLDPEPDDEEEDDLIRCICQNDNPKDKRAFIGCDACGVWQHNVCMGITDDGDDIPEHYFCEDCRPEEHQETLQSKENDSPGNYVWERRNKICQNEKKMSKSRKSKGGREVGKPGWLKKELSPPAAEPETDNVEAPAEPEVAEVVSNQPESGNKRKREEPKVEEAEAAKEEDTPETKRAGRADKRRKSSGPTAAKAEPPDVEHSIVEIDQLPTHRQKVAETLSDIIAKDVQARMKSGQTFQEGQTAESISNHQAKLIEYALQMNHGGSEQYRLQFRSLIANMKKNTMLIGRLLDESLTADELAKMKSEDMASEELQRERAEMKAELDRQAIAVEAEGPEYRNTHKGIEKIEQPSKQTEDSSFNAQPVRERAEGDDVDAASPAVPTAASPTISGPMVIDTKGSGGHDRRTSSQQFDMDDIWKKTAQSPTLGGPAVRPMQQPPRRRSSIQPRPEQAEGAKVDADVDRLLADHDESYSPAEFTSDATIVWRGKLVQSTGDGEPTVNARFVAGRDLASTISWNELLPEKLSVDGRLQIEKAEEYLCGLEWSNTSDVSVLSLTPYDDAAAFNVVFNYFHSRKRYAVVTKGLQSMVKDLYIIPVEVGSGLPDHVTKLEHCTIKTPVESRILLATFVVARSPETPRNAPTNSTSSQRASATNGHHLPTQVYPGAQGPAGSPLTAFSPSMGKNGGQPTAGYGAPSPFPPNPYGPQVPEPSMPHPPPAAYPQHPNPAVNEILGPLQMAPSAQQILAADGNITVDKLRNLRRILEEDPNTRNDILALATKLGAA